MGILDNAKKTIIEQVIWAESNLAGKTGAEKKAAVVKKLDDLIQLPAYLEWVDDIIIAYVVDQACKKLNELTNKNFAGLVMSDEDKTKMASEIEVQDNG